MEGCQKNRLLAEHMPVVPGATITSVTCKGVAQRSTRASPKQLQTLALHCRCNQCESALQQKCQERTCKPTSSIRQKSRTQSINRNKPRQDSLCNQVQSSQSSAIALMTTVMTASTTIAGAVVRLREKSGSSDQDCFGCKTCRQDSLDPDMLRTMLKLFG